MMDLLPSVIKLGSCGHTCGGPPGCADQGSREPQPTSYQTTANASTETEAPRPLPSGAVTDASRNKPFFTWSACPGPGVLEGVRPGSETGVSVEVFRIPGAPNPSPGQRGTYSIPVRCQGGIHQVLVDIDSTQTLVH